MSTTGPARSPVGCACGHSLALICGIAAAGSMAALLAQDRCLDLGGRLSDAAWICEAGSRAIPFWSLVSAQSGVLALLLVGVPVYFAVRAIGRRYGW